MCAIPVDLAIHARWIVPMTLRAEVLGGHALIVRNGRILDLLSSAEADRKYQPAARVLRPAHALLPGLVNADIRASRAPLRGFQPAAAPAPREARMAAFERRHAGTDLVRDGVQLAIAQLLAGGATCFADRHSPPAETAATAAGQGMRAVIGMQVADDPAAGARTAGEHFTAALELRDDYKGHPLISTCFAPQGDASDATFTRLATLAAELDAGVWMDLHESAAAVRDSLATFGRRPIERLDAFGMMTPALTAVHMVAVTPGDIALAQRSGIAVCLCPETDLRRGTGPPPIAALAAAGLRWCLGGGARGDASPWSAVRLAALLSGAGGADTDAPGVWDVLAAATRGGAAAFGLDAEIGTLEVGKWADLCCIDFGAPALSPSFELLEPLVFAGSRDMVADVWVAGRQLLAGGTLTRLDWPGVAAHADEWAARITAEG